jgi:hypothetical protein
MDEMIQKYRDFYLPQKMKPDILRYFRSYDGKHGTQFAVHAASTTISLDPHGLMLSGSVARQIFTSNRWFDRN